MIGDREAVIEDANQQFGTILTFADQRILRSLLQINEDVNLRILISKRIIPELKEVSNNLMKGKVEKFRNLAENSMKACKKFPFSFFLKERF